MLSSQVSREPNRTMERGRRSSARARAGVRMWSEHGWGAGPGLQPPVFQGCAPDWCGEGVTLQAGEAPPSLPEVDPDRWHIGHYPAARPTGAGSLGLRGLTATEEGPAETAWCLMDTAEVAWAALGGGEPSSQDV